MVIAEAGFGRQFNPRVAQLHKEILWAGDAAEGQRVRRQIAGRDGAVRAPHQLAVEREHVLRGAAGEHHGVGAGERGERLAQAAGRQQAVVRVFGGDQHDIEIARQGAVLEAVVEQVQARGKALFRQPSGGEALLAHDHRHLQLARDQQGLVAKIAGSSAGIDHGDPAGAAAVAAREHVEGDATLLQQFAQQHHERRLSRIRQRTSCRR